MAVTGNLESRCVTSFCWYSTHSNSVQVSYCRVGRHLLGSRENECSTIKNKRCLITVPGTVSTGSTVALYTVSYEVWGTSSNRYRKLLCLVNCTLYGELFTGTIMLQYRLQYNTGTGSLVTRYCIFFYSRYTVSRITGTPLQYTGTVYSTMKRQKARPRAPIPGTRRFWHYQVSKSKHQYR
jgi:hypothetical protein